MARLILVCGRTGAGKTTYSISVCQNVGAVKFSIDPWMQTLFSKDMTSLDYAWMIERVNRCYEQIWEVSKQILELNGNVLLDLGFTTKTQRDFFVTKANTLHINTEIHYLDIPKHIRLNRIKKRNIEKDPAVYSFDVTDMMFNFMESKFEAPNNDELKYGLKPNLEFKDTYPENN